MEEVAERREWDFGVRVGFVESEEKEVGAVKMG